MGTLNENKTSAVAPSAAAYLILKEARKMKYHSIEEAVAEIQRLRKEITRKNSALRRIQALAGHNKAIHATAGIALREKRQ